MRQQRNLPILRAYWRFLSQALLRRWAIAGCIAGALLIIMIANARVLFQNTPAQPEVLASATTIRNKLPQAINRHTQPLGIVMSAAFWGAVGLIVYGIGWLTHGLTHNVAGRKARARGQLATAYVLLLLHSLVLGILGYLLYKMVLPAVSYPHLWQTDTHKTYLWAGASAVALSMYLYAMLTVARMVGRTVRFMDAATTAQRHAATRRRGRPKRKHSGPHRH
jgi:hypothetical protein